MKNALANMVLDIGGGKMNRQQANIEASKIFDERNRKADEIIKKAKADGTWQSGLDSNKGLFKKLDEETREKLKNLAEMIDEDKETL